MLQCVYSIHSMSYIQYMYVYIFYFCKFPFIDSCKRFCIEFPSCPTGVNLDSSTLGNNGCDVSLTWQQPPNTPPVTSATVTYCPTSSPNCEDGMNCTSPCTISGLLNDTEYQFTVTPNNNCGSPTGCTGNTMTRSE